ncbi:MAG: hypothetical protein H8E98_03670 [Bacteroidetes bacterium]|nr:hypothetical protein [Bacteroidota bacterium]
MFYFKTGFIGTFKRQGNFIANKIKPWAKKKSILLTAFEGFSFGSERGQIKRISDHNHIIPLYDFGVGTYDFDLEKVVSNAKLAREMAEKDVTKYFEET